MGFIREVIGFISILYFLSACGGILSVSILLDVNYEDHTDKYKLIIDSWKLEPILELRVSQEKCLENETTFLKYTWPGTRIGCDCTNIEANGLFSQIIFPFICNSTHLAYKCEIIVSHDQAKFESFPTPSNSSYRLCGNRTLGHSFYLTENICQEGEHQCGEMTDTQYCSINGICPIYSLEIVTSQQLNQSKEYLQLSQEDYLIISRTSDSYFPINQLKVSEMQGPCADANQLSITPGRIDYILMNNKKQVCELDLNFHLIQATNEVDYYKVNDFSFIANVLPGYVIDSQYQWGIFQSRYIEWKFECRGIILSNFKGHEEFLSQIEQENLIVLYISILYTICVCSLIITNCCSEGYDCCCCPYKIKKRLDLIFHLIIKTSASITLYYFIIPIYSNLNDVIKDFQTIIDQKCSDSHTVSGLNTLLYNLSTYLHYYYEILIYILSLTLIFEISVIIVQITKNIACRCVMTCFKPAERERYEIQQARVVVPMPIMVQIKAEEIHEKRKEEFEYQEASIPGEDNQDHKIYHFVVEQNNNDLFENKAE